MHTILAMAYITNHSFKANRYYRFRYYCSILLLNAILCLAISPTALADSLLLQFKLSQASQEMVNKAEFTIPCASLLISQTGGNTGSDRIPVKLVDGIRQDLSRRTGIAAYKFKLIEANQQTWTDGCLGLAKPDEICTQALVEGWRVILSYGSQTWVYRSDKQGRNIRLESQNPKSNI